MYTFLVFKLEGLLASWGEAALATLRTSQEAPTRSALLGLVAAAMGVKREDTEGLKALREGLAFGCVVNSPGTRLRDFHTIQVRKGGDKDKFEVSGSRNRITRKEELSDKAKLGTAITIREYLNEVAYTIVVWGKGPGYDLEKVQRALETPVFIPYLGRKSCPLSAPMEPQILNVPTMKEAYFKAEFLEDLREPGKECFVSWEETGVAIGVPGEFKVWRRDEPFSRKTWTFSERQETRGTLLVE